MSTTPRGLFVGADAKLRCSWCAADAAYVAYHDEEWGIPEHDNQRLFETLSLEGFQSGLSWITVLRKRDAFRRAFADFDIDRVARFTPRKVEALLQDAGIVRHRGKIESTIQNARRAREIVAEFGSFAAYVWRFEPGGAARPKRIIHSTLAKLGSTPESIALSKDLKRRGFRFVGPTTVYAFMQAVGLVNDHLEGCHVRAIAERARARR